MKEWGTRREEAATRKLQKHLATLIQLWFCRCDRNLCLSLSIMYIDRKTAPRRINWKFVIARAAKWGEANQCDSTVHSQSTKGFCAESTFSLSLSLASIFPALTFWGFPSFLCLYKSIQFKYSAEGWHEKCPIVELEMAFNLRKESCFGSETKQLKQFEFPEVWLMTEKKEANSQCQFVWKKPQFPSPDVHPSSVMPPRPNRKNIDSVCLKRLIKL